MTLPLKTEHVDAERETLLPLKTEHVDAEGETLLPLKTEHVDAEGETLLPLKTEHVDAEGETMLAKVGVAGWPKWAYKLRVPVAQAVQACKHNVA